MFSTCAYAEAKEPTELFVGGVFEQRSRVTPEQLERSAEASKPVRPPAFFKESDIDDTCAASQILMLFDAAPSAGEISAIVASKAAATPLRSVSARYSTSSTRRRMARYFHYSVGPRAHDFWLRTIA